MLPFAACRRRRKLPSYRKSPKLSKREESTQAATESPSSAFADQEDRPYVLSLPQWTSPTTTITTTTTTEAMEQGGQMTWPLTIMALDTDRRDRVKDKDKDKDKDKEENADDTTKIERCNRSLNSSGRHGRLSLSLSTSSVNSSSTVNSPMGTPHNRPPSPVLVDEYQQRVLEQVLLSMEESVHALANAVGALNRRARAAALSTEQNGERRQQRRRPLKCDHDPTLFETHIVGNYNTAWMLMAVHSERSNCYGLLISDICMAPGTGEQQLARVVYRLLKHAAGVTLLLEPDMGYVLVDGPLLQSHSDAVQTTLRTVFHRKYFERMHGYAAQLIVRSPKTLLKARKSPAKSPRRSSRGSEVKRHANDSSVPSQESL